MIKNKFIFLLLIGLIFCLSISVASAEDVDNLTDVNTDDVIGGSDFTIQSNNLTKYYHNDSQFVVKVLDNESNPVSGENVSFEINGDTYNRISNSTGYAKFDIKLEPGDYVITTSFKNVSVTNKVTVLPFILSNNLVKYFQNDSQFVVRLLNKSGSPLAGKKVSFNVNGFVYGRTTNESGYAKFDINLPPEDYIISCSYDDLTVSNNISVLSTVVSPNLVKYFQNDSQYIVKSLDKNGNPLGGQKLSFNINGILYNRTTNESGLAKININLPASEYIISIYYGNLALSSNITVLPVIISDNLVKYFQNDSQFIVGFLDGEGKPAQDRNVSFNINGVFYNRITNNLGQAKLDINLPVKDYIITIFFGNSVTSNNVSVLSRLIEITGDVNTSYGKNASFKFKVVNKSGAPLKNSLVEYDINGFTIRNYTDSEGVATLILSMAAGSYDIKYLVDGLTGSALCNIKNSIKLGVFKWGDGGDVTKNSWIKDNLGNSTLFTDLVKAAKAGTPMVTVKGGEGKSVFITSGTHGNEISSQVAVLRLISSLETTPISGTLYIMPFICPKDTELNVRRYNGVDLNRVAHQDGTISNKIIKLIANLNCDAYGDFHCTQSPGVPGIDVIMGTPSPTPESAAMARYISRVTGFEVDNQLLTGDLYYGSLAVQTNMNGIPSVLCEVISVPGSMDVGSDIKSAKQINEFLKYNNIL